jgi:hypothetical protein
MTEFGVPRRAIASRPARSVSTGYGGFQRHFSLVKIFAMGAVLGKVLIWMSDNSGTFSAA